MPDQPRLDLAQRPTPLEYFFTVLMVPLLLLEIFVFAIAVALPAGSLRDALSGPGSPDWWAALGWATWLVATVGLLIFLVHNQRQSKMGHPGYLFRRFFRSRLLVGADGVDLGDGGTWPLSEITGFEVRRDVRFAPRAGSWTEVSAVMHVRSGEVLELPALGCFDERWRKHVSGVEQRVERLNLRLWSGG